MTQQTAKIFLADKRRRFASNDYRCLSTPINSTGSEAQIIRFSDETLAQGKTKLFTMDTDALLLLVPLVGSVVLANTNTKHSTKVRPEELQLLPLKKGMGFSIKNPSKDRLANYLQIWLRFDLQAKKISFNNYEQNTLAKIIENPKFNLHFGVLDGRVECNLIPSNKKNTIFSFVINGAFELQNRLLESRDALMLWDVEQLEMEALSENAIILVLEKNNSC